MPTFFPIPLFPRHHLSSLYIVLISYLFFYPSENISYTLFATKKAWEGQWLTPKFTFISDLFFFVMLHMTLLCFLPVVALWRPFEWVLRMQSQVGGHQSFAFSILSLLNTLLLSPRKSAPLLFLSPFSQLPSRTTVGLSLFSPPFPVS